jgi:hypothetical protein
MFARQYQCPDCGSDEGYRSRPRNLYEKYVLRLFLLQPVRCAECFRRSWVSMFAEVQERRPKPLTRRLAA